jgi:hypothetical protein
MSTDRSTTVDPGTPYDLLPVSGEVARSRTTHESIYLVHIPHRDDLLPLDGPVDLTTPPDPSQGLYEKPAEGVIVTTEQEWVPRGVGLGRLLHSLTLAPGESTRMAVVDWSRRVLARTEEATAQEERVSEEAVQKRSTSEITDALATERQFGSSEARSDTTSASVGGSFGLATLTSMFGFSASRSRSRGVATNVARTAGTRKLSTSTAQEIQQRTEQLATSSRELRATAIVETSEAEASTASTRVITNYNHMHALTIQYWEVIQTYEVRTRASRFERCLFVPMQVLTFDDDLFRRYQPVLAAVAPEPWAERIGAVDPSAPSLYRTRSSSGESSEWNRTGRVVQTQPMGTRPPRLVHLGATVDVKYTGPREDLKGRTFRYWGVAVDEPAGAVGWTPEEGWVRLGLCEMRSANASWRVQRNNRGELEIPGMPLSTKQVHEDRSTGITYRVGPDDKPRTDFALDRVPLPEDAPVGSAEQLTAWWDEDGVRGVKLSMQRDPDRTIGALSGPGSRTIDLGEDERIVRIVSTNVRTPWGRTLRRFTVTTDRQGEITFGPTSAGEQEELQSVDVRGGTLCGLFGSVEPVEEHVVSLGFQLRGMGVRADVIDHLNDNTLYYSQAIWMTADELALTRLLANFAYDDGRGTGAEPLGARLDPVPIAMTGNYLGFRWHFPDEEAQEAWMEDRALVRSRWQRGDVSLATDGVFAEAVLGRSNGAEKLDLTRFWDWQTSPIPILPSEIAAVDTGSRARDVAAATGQLAPPVAATHALPTLPDPTGTAAILQAIATGGLFRDMSGLEATSSLLQKGLEIAAQSEGKSAEQATTAMKQASEHMQKMSQIAIDAAKEVAPLVLGPAGAAAGALGNVSKLGALLNFAERDGSG